MQTIKQIVHDIADHLPEQATFDDALYALYVRQKLEEGLRDLDEGRTQGRRTIGANTMQPQTLKQEALESLQHLSDNADIDKIMYRLYVVDKIRKSREAIERGDTISHEELKREIEQW